MAGSGLPHLANGRSKALMPRQSSGRRARAPLRVAAEVSDNRHTVEKREETMRPLSMTARVRQVPILFGNRRQGHRIHLRAIYPCVLVGLVAWWGHSIAASGDTPLATVTRSQLCVTEGAIEQSGAGRRWSVTASKMRAYVNFITEPVVEARFRYLGPTANEAPLGSGALRRQFGLKLRAQDACNLVYAMWRIEPEPKLVVSVKSNPGQHTSAECGNRGYRNVRPRRSVPVPALAAGGEHALRVETNGAQLRVFADNELVWDGSVAPDALGFDGPVGIRSDNARLEIELLAGPALKTTAQPAPTCRAGAGETE